MGKLLHLAIFIAIGLPTSGYALSCNENNKNDLIVRADVGTSDASGTKSWNEYSVAISKNYSDCRYNFTARYEAYDRFGISNQGFGLEATSKTSDDGYWRLATLIGPDAVFRPKWAVELERGKPFKFEAGPFAAIVGSASAKLAEYDTTKLVAVGLVGEFYPRGLNAWATGRITQTISDKDALPAAFIGRFDVPLTDTTRVFALRATGYEANLTVLERVDSIAIGVQTQIGTRLDLVASIAEDERSIGPKRRTAAISLARAF
jgi:hypothetical protein